MNNRPTTAAHPHAALFSTTPTTPASQRSSSDRTTPATPQRAAWSRPRTGMASSTPEEVCARGNEVLGPVQRPARLRTAESVSGRRPLARDRARHALGVPDAFMPSFDHGALRVLEYPAGAGSEMHTDVGLFTINCYRNDPNAGLPVGEVHMGRIAREIGLCKAATPHQVLPCSPTCSSRSCTSRCPTTRRRYRAASASGRGSTSRWPKCGTTHRQSRGRHWIAERIALRRPRFGTTPSDLTGDPPDVAYYLLRPQ
jgi:hypothetical protein